MRFIRKPNPPGTPELRQSAGLRVMMDRRVAKLISQGSFCTEFLVQLRGVRLLLG